MKLFKKILRNCVLFWGVIVLAQNICGQNPKVKAIDNFIKPFAEASHFSGVVLASDNGKIIYEKGFGMANATHQVINKPKTLFPVASITKPMTLVILASLLEQKKITLQDTLNKYIPDFPKGDKITIEMLARHRSGIPHRVTTTVEEKVSYSTAEIVEKIKKAELAFEPGSQSLYSSAGYTTLARVLEIVSGKTYSQLLQKYVFEPVAMTDSTDFDSEKIIPHRVDGYMLDADGFVNASLLDFSFLTGAGSVFSTAKDIHTFSEAIVDGKFGELVRQSLVKEDVFASNGFTNGFRANVRISRSEKYGYVVVSNLASGANDLIIQNLRAILEGKEVSTPIIPKPKIVPDSNKNLSDFSGKYNLGSSEFEVFVKGNEIYVGDYKLLPLGKDLYYNFWSYAEIAFVRNEKGMVKGLKWGWFKHQIRMD